MGHTHGAREKNEAAEIDAVVARLAKEFDAVPQPVIESHVRGSVAEFAEARVRDFVPVLTERAVRKRLRSETKPN